MARVFIKLILQFFIDAHNIALYCLPMSTDNQNSTKNDLPARLRAQAEMFSFNADFDPEQLKWMLDLLEAASELEWQRKEINELDQLRERMSGILKKIAITVRGPEPPLKCWSWHDLPERVADAIAAREKDHD